MAVVDDAHSLGDGECIVLGELSLGPGDPTPTREQVEPYVAALLQAEHLNLLLGSGLTVGLAHLAGFSGGPDMGAALETETEDLSGAIEKAAQKSARRMGRGEPNIEDRLRVAITASEGLAFVDDPRSGELRRSVDAALRSLRDSDGATEEALRAAANDVVAEVDPRGIARQGRRDLAGSGTDRSTASKRPSSELRGCPSPATMTASAVLNRCAETPNTEPTEALRVSLDLDAFACAKSLDPTGAVG